MLVASLAAVYVRLLACPPGLAPDVPTPALAPLLADLCQQAAQVGLEIHLKPRVPWLYMPPRPCFHHMRLVMATPM